MDFLFEKMHENRLLFLLRVNFMQMLKKPRTLH